MDIDFSKFKSGKNESSVKTDEHSKKSVTNSGKNDSVSSFDEVRKSDNEDRTSVRKDLSKNDYDTLEIIQEETKKLSDVNLNSINEKDSEKEAKYKGGGRAIRVTRGNTVVNYAKSFIGYNGSDGSADIFIKHVFGNDTYLHAGNDTENSAAWCASFVCFNLENSGVQVPEWYSSMEHEDKALVHNVYVAADEGDALIDKSEVQPGDIMMIDRHDDGWYDHIAFVTKIDEDGTIHTLEGNAPEVDWVENGVEHWIDDEGVVKEKTYAPDYEEKNKAKFAFARIN